MAAANTTILVVEDNEGVRQVFTEILTNAGYRVLAAADGEAGHKLALAHSVQLALVDILMEPGIDGIDLIKRWKEKGMLNFPAAIVSGHATINLAVEAMRQGAVDVLVKPVNAKDLLKFVTKMVSAEDHSGSSDRALRATDLGRSPDMVNLKSALLKAMTGTAPVLFVGSPSAGSELFARLLHSPGKPWAEYVDMRFLTTDPTGRLNEVRHGTIYLRSLQGFSEMQQRGLYQLLRNAQSYDVRVMAESPQTSAELLAAGGLSEELAEAFASYEIPVPDFGSYVDDLYPVLIALARVIEHEPRSGPPVVFSPEALQLMAADGYRWVNGGMESLLGIFRTLVRMAKKEQIGVDEVHGLLHVEPFDSSKVLDSLNIYGMPLRQAREVFEEMYFRKLMERSQSNFKEAARLSGLERTYIYRKVKSLLPEQNTSPS